MHAAKTNIETLECCIVAQLILKCIPTYYFCSLHPRYTGPQDTFNHGVASTDEYELAFQ